jgi:nicotinamidase-related amidase
MKPDDLRYGPLGATCAHLCVDMQRLFAEDTEWKMPWLERVLPTIVSLVAVHPAQTLFTRFIPAREKGQGNGMWRHYYERWSRMTIEELGPEMIDIVPELAVFIPPARIFDKYVYSPWIGSDLHQRLRCGGNRGRSPRRDCPTAYQGTRGPRSALVKPEAAGSAHALP